jgi:DNA-binding NarL/FixJ family response regulator
MNTQMLLTVETASLSLSLVSLVTSVLVFMGAHRMKRTSSSLRSWIDEELNAISKDLDTVSSKSGDHGRRVAWLEARNRSSRVETKQTQPETVAMVNQKPTITERRHRVLSLARRGQDPQTIARTLGMPDGEVELMINLGRRAA